MASSHYQNDAQYHHHRLARSQRLLKDAQIRLTRALSDIANSRTTVAAAEASLACAKLARGALEVSLTIKFAERDLRDAVAKHERLSLLVQTLQREVLRLTSELQKVEADYDAFLEREEILRAWEEQRRTEEEAEWEAEYAAREEERRKARLDAEAEEKKTWAESAARSSQWSSTDRITSTAITKWLLAAEKALADYASITSFPDPPTIVINT